MKVLTSWLREFANPQVSDEELAETLTMAGLEVDGISTIAPDFNSVVVGLVESCEKHPDADKLNLCQVNVETEVLQIICGAKNVRKGLKVCVAKSGAVLPGNFKIKKAKLRGVESNGMICSESEIGLADKSEGIMELDESLQIGANIREALNLDDKIIELDITPNRGDCFSMLGVAREVCASYGLNIDYSKHYDFNNIIKPSGKSSVSVSVEAKKHCPKYLTRTISGIDNTKQTPKWLADILTRSGQSLHSPVVDITNFVLLEFGQPLHAFDKNSIDELNVRLSKQGEKITLLNEQEVELKAETLIIASSKNPVAIAGVMGGMDSSTTPKSTEIVLEAAFFDNVLMAGVARNYGLHTESSLRFERGVDYNLPEMAIDRATELVIEICGGEPSEIISSISESDLPKQNEINIKYSKISKILGFEMDKNWILEKFQSLNFEIIKNTTDEITIKAPSYRFDINIEADLIEELARLYGYDKLPTAKLSLESNLQKATQVNKYDLKNILTARNYNEVITYSFISEKMFDLSKQATDKKTQLLNPISKDMSIMRTSIIAGLLKTASDNLNRGQNDLRIFETGLCFNGLDSHEQVEKIAGLITGKTNNGFNKNKEFDFFDLKADLLSIVGVDKNIKFTPCENNLLQKGQSADVLIDGEKCGIIGALSPKITKELSLNKSFVFEIDLSKILIKNNIKYQQFSIYQSSSRDISMLFDKKISYDEIITSINSLKQKNLIEIKLVDVWNGDDIENDKHSLTISLSYQAQDKTLTDEEIDNPVKKIVKLLTKEYNAEQR
jgi:phenylalanyl-tRNA synthetase beta chain